MSEPAAGRTPLYPPTFLLLAILLMVALHFALPLVQLINAPWRWHGVFPLALGMALVLWPAGLFNRAGTTIRPFERSSALVVGGPYRLSRNPIYLGMAIILVGVGVLAGSLTPFLVVPVFMVLIERRFIRKEEAMLEQAFGASYAAYKARVRRWI